MQITSAAPTRILLNGKWTMTESAARLSLLVGELARLLAAEPRPARADIDLAGVTEIDACGCQLMTVFLEHLKGVGVTPQPTGISRGVMDMIHLLGFAEAFDASGAPAKEKA